jgi:hypothetical protein
MKAKAKRDQPGLMCALASFAKYLSHWQLKDSAIRRACVQWRLS